jgi:hypothetical protein
MFDISKILTDVKEAQLKKLEEINDKIKQEQLKKDPSSKSSVNSFTMQLTNEVSKYLKTFPGNTPEQEQEPDGETEKGEKGEKNQKKEKSKHTKKNISSPETSFKLPICYLEDSDKREINTNILNDLELLEAKNDDCVPMYETIFKPESTFSKRYVALWSRYYTTNVDFLKESQTFYQSYVNQYGCKLSEPLRMILDDKNNYTYKPYKTGDDTGSSATAKSGVIIFPHDVYNTIDKLWIDIAGDKNFKQRFSYIDLPMLDSLNKSPVVMQLMSVYNLTSPVISLLSPLILLFIPFFLLKIQKSQVSLSTYVTSLKTILSSHPIGKVFSLLDFSSMPWDKRIYVLMSVFFYFIQVYQNVMSCYRFYKNMILIHKNIFILNDYFRYTIRNMKHVIQMSHSLITYREFTNDLKAKVQHLEKLCGMFSKIKPFAVNFKKFTEIGQLMKLNYEIFVDHDIKSCVDYSFGFNGFYENVDHIKQMIDSSRINPCVFIGGSEDEDKDEDKDKDEDQVVEADELPERENEEKGENGEKENKIKKSKKNTSNISKTSTKSDKSSRSKSSTSSSTLKKHTSFKQLYYPPYETPIKNDVVINKKIIITGPNAAGKTTIIKSTLMNIILSQQIGYGFYDSANIKPYDYLHSYLNIPDTSGRDSLFQAESRRCKEILDSLEKENDKRHFCIFDELYSGTNPYEAVASAYGYIDYLSSMKNVDLMLTTHYISLCNNLKTNKKIKNYKMKVDVEEDYNVKYLYKLERGISKIKGGIKVLYDLEYPKAIIENTKQLLMSM